MKTPPNRIGSFRITLETLDHLEEEQTATVLALLMAQVVIVRAECDYASRTIEYTAYCKGFDEVPQGEKPPTYQWLITKSEVEGEEGKFTYTVVPQRCAHELRTYTVEDIRL